MAKNSMSNIKTKILNACTKIKEDKSTFIKTLVGLFFALLILIGASYAYFTKQDNFPGFGIFNTSTSTTDLLEFHINKDIKIVADNTNFSAGKDNLKDDATALATLRANNSTNEANAVYNLYFVIEENDFIYSTEGKTPEILFRVTDPNNNVVEHITGLVYKDMRDYSLGNIQGFDITTRKDSFLLVADYPISSTGEQVTQSWKVEVELINLATPQNVNAGKTLSGSLYITQDQKSTYELLSLTGVTTNSKSYDQISITLNEKAGSASSDKYYFASEKLGVAQNVEPQTEQLSSKANKFQATFLGTKKVYALDDDELTWYETDRPTYTFSGLDENSRYKIYAYALDKNGIKSNTYDTEITTDKYIVPTITNVTNSSTLDSITLNVTASNGNGEIENYLYSCDGGRNFVSDGASHTFNDLDDTTDYEIVIKVKDVNNRFSNDYEEIVSTAPYIYPEVATVTAETTSTSITLTPVPQLGSTNPVDHYEYSTDLGDNWVTTNVFEELTPETEYTILVKAVDTIGRRQPFPYTAVVTTDEYVIPSVTATATGGQDSITISATSTLGNGTSISKYKYSKDDGLTWEIEESTNLTNSHTFSGLTGGTKFYVQVIVEDNTGEESLPYKLTAKTTSSIEVAVSYDSTPNRVPFAVGPTVALSCNGNNATYNGKFHRLEISSLTSNFSTCSLDYTSRTSTTPFNAYIAGLVNTTQGTGSVVAETAKYIHSDATFTKVAMNYSTTSTDAMTVSDNVYTGTSSVERTTSYHKFEVIDSGYYRICYTIPTSLYEGYSVTYYVNRLGIYIPNSTSSTGAKYILSTNHGEDITACHQYTEYMTEGNYFYIYQVYQDDNISLWFERTTDYEENASAGIRYEGKDPNNFVWFNNELWRVIGVFDDKTHGQNGKQLVKIIRANSLNRLTWDNTQKQDWSTSSLKNILNTSYYNALDGSSEDNCYGTKDISTTCNFKRTGIQKGYRNMISEANWYLGQAYYKVNPIDMFAAERSSSRFDMTAPTLITAHVGLMYPSDYLFATPVDNCPRTTLSPYYNNENCAGKNWLTGFGYESTITPNLYESEKLLILNTQGYIYSDTLANGYSYRPVVYLKDSVYMISGDGTRANPYIIGM